MKFRIYTIYAPYKGPPTPSAVYEWAAICIDPLPTPVMSTWTGRDLRFEQCPAVWGGTRELAIENLKRTIKERFTVAREHHGCAIEQGEVEVTSQESATINAAAQNWRCIYDNSRCTPLASPPEESVH